MNTMKRIALGTVGLLLPLVVLTPADAAQSPAHCKTLSVTSVTSPDLARMAWRIDTTTVSRCRGQVVTVITTSYRPI